MIPHDEGLYSDRAEDGSVPFIVGQLEGFLDELVHGRAVAYVGAGISMSANLISWGDLLAGLQEKAERRLELEEPAARRYFKQLTTLERNLEIGDWLLDILDSGEFCRTIKQLTALDRDKQKPVPSAVHHHLARLPFSMALTTNYDLLLEDAYRAADKWHGSPFTWCDTQRLLDAIKSSEFAVVHVHGVLDKPETLVLSGSQYANLQHSGAAPNQDHAPLRFGEVFQWLLKTKTFLFLGASLQDPDLIFHLQEIKAELGKSAIKHYALMPAGEAPLRRRKILKENLNIEVLPVGNRQMMQAGKGWLTTALAGVLRDLSARVAMKSFEFGLARFPTSDDTGFCLNAALNALLEEAVRITGSFRGDFCLPENPGSHGSGVLRYAIHTKDRTENKIQDHPVVPPNSICGIAYYQATAEYGIYVTDVHRQILSPLSQLGHYGEIHYEVGHTAVNSELAMPIDADGVRVGVLNLESNLIDAYSLEHLEAARRIAEKAGRLYAAANERQRRATRLSPRRTEPAYAQMRDLCVQLWQIARNRRDIRPEIALLIYHADYQTCMLVSQNPVGTVLPLTAKNVETPAFFFQHGSKRPSLTTRVYGERRPYAYPDADKAVAEGKLPADSYPKQLDIHGPLIGFPVSIHGHVCGVVASWLRKSPAMELDGRDIELFRRASHVMANCFQFEREKGLPEGDERYPSTELVAGLLDCVTNPPSPEEPSQPELLNEIGRYYLAEVGSAMAAFLNLLREREKQFAEKMAAWYAYSPRPTLWVAPRRCRCWIRCGKAANGKPRFLLALQVAIDGTAPYKNLITLRGQRLGVTMQPFRSAPGNHARRSQPAPEAADGARPTPRDVVQVTVDGHLHQVRSLIFDDNPHLSFLLSRVSAYPFAFQQKPRVMGRDIMSEVLEKDPSLPWFVSPLIVNHAEDWSDSAPASASRIADQRLAGYLTFDNGCHDIRKPWAVPAAQSPEIEVSDQWAAFQNDLIHQTDVFAACLAQRPCFQSLLANLDDKLGF